MIAYGISISYPSQWWLFGLESCRGLLTHLTLLTERLPHVILICQASAECSLDFGAETDFAHGVDLLFAGYKSLVCQSLVLEPFKPLA